MYLVIPNTVGLAQLALLTGTGGLLNGAKIHLYKNAPPLVPTITLANLTECDFSGYAASGAVTWSTPYLSLAGVPTVVGSSKFFGSADPLTVANMVTGYYITDSAGTVLIGVEAFDSPVNIYAPNLGIVVLPSFAFGQLSPNP